MRSEAFGEAHKAALTYFLRAVKATPPLLCQGGPDPVAPCARRRDSASSASYLRADGPSAPTDPVPQLSLGFPPLKGFDARDFVVSRPNLDAFSALQSWPGAEGGAMALVGEPGAGKSHLSAMWAARRGARRLRPDDRAERLGDAAGCILVEDVDAGFRDETLFHLINLGKRPGCGLLLTGRTPPQTWAPQIADLRSRLNAMPVLMLEAPDDAILEGMLQTFFRQRSIRPTQELLDYLVRRIERSAVAAETAVERLHAAASAAGRPVGRRLAQSLFAEAEADE